MGSGRLWKKNGIYVLSLKGTYSEMAAQHGRLLKEAALKGALPYLGQKNAHLIGHAPLFKKSKFIQNFALRFIRLLQKPMMAQIPLIHKEETLALSRASGIPYDQAMQAIMQSDTLILLLRYTMGRYLLNQMGTSYGLPGCTSVVALNQHPVGSGLIHARNMDYPAVGFWDVYPTVYYSDPTDGGQRTIAITSAGVHTTGITGLNESGLTLSIHFHCSRKVSIFGTPINILANEVLRKAKTISQAIDLIKSFSSAGSWSIVLSSARENEAVVVEMVHGELEVRFASENQGILANTNTFRSENLKKTEILLNTTSVRDFEERYDRALYPMRRHSDKNPFSLTHAAEILADHFDQELNMIRTQGNTISVVTTMTSLISQLGEGKFYMANRPESPVCLGNYVTFDLDEAFENFDEKNLEETNLLHQSKTSIRGTTKEESMRYFRNAYMAFHNDFSSDQAQENLNKALEITPDEGNFWLASGHMLMRLKKPEQAIHAFKKAKDCPLRQTLIETADLFIGHCFDTLGQRDKALEVYKNLLRKPPISPLIKKELQKRLKTPYSIEKAEDITFDFQYCDCFEYA